MEQTSQPRGHEICKSEEELIEYTKWQFPEFVDFIVILNLDDAHLGSISIEGEYLALLANNLVASERG